MYLKSVFFPSTHHFPLKGFSSKFWAVQTYVYVTCLLFFDIYNYLIETREISLLVHLLGIIFVILFHAILLFSILAPQKLKEEVVCFKML